MTEQQIKPEDIHVGDSIRVEWMVDDILYSQTGTVAEIDKNGDFQTKSELVIGPAYIKERIRKGEQITITLLDRHKPKLPTEVGSVIHVSEYRGVKCDTLAILNHYGTWYTPTPVERHSFHNHSDITEWEPRNVVEVQE